MKKSSLKGRLVAGGIWAFGGSAVSIVLGLALNAFLTRLLSPEEVGVYYLALSLVGGATVCAHFGLNPGIVRLVAESIGSGQAGLARGVIFAALLITAVGTLVAGTVVFLGNSWLADRVLHAPMLRDLQLLIVVWIGIVAFQEVFTETFRGFQDIRLASVFGVPIARFVLISFCFYLWFRQGFADIVTIVSLTVVAGLIGNTVAGACLHYKMRLLKGEVIVSIRRVLALCVPLFVTNITLFILTQADIWILGAFHTKESVALYGSSYRLVLLVSIPLVLANSVIAPFIAELYAKKRNEELENMIRISAALAALPAVIAFLAYIVSGRILLGLMYGEFYREGYCILVLLALGQVFTVCAGPCGYTLMMTGNQKVMMVITLIAGLITISLGLMLVKPYGAAGVAVGTAAGTGLQALAMMFAVKRTVGIWTYMHIGSLKQLKTAWRSL